MARLVLLFVLFLIPLGLCQTSNDIVLESTIVQCNNEDALEVGSAKRPIRLASSYKGHANFNLKLYSKCSKKLLITLRVTDKTRGFISNSLVILNHAKNALTHRSSRLGRPLAIKFHQDRAFQKYPFKHLYRVNAKVVEEVKNLERNKTYKGCDNSPLSNNPTCGFYPRTKERTVAGFCCSCTEQMNNIQQRGGQRCDVSNKSAELLTSSHCLRPSQFHYNVYELQHPTLFQRLTVEVFRSEDTKSGNLTWYKMSASSHGVSVDNENTVTASGGVKVSYRPHLQTLHASAHIFKIGSQRLLAPAPNPYQDPDFFPAPFKGSLSSQLLIVPKTLMSPHGAQCDHVGTSINAFLYQKDPCRQSSQSCLKNQPFDLWKLDKGVAGPVKYKLSSFRNSELDVPPFVSLDDEHKSGSLYAEHPTSTPTSVFIEVPADDIIVLAPGYNAFIESVLTDTGSDGAKLVTHIMNKELVAAPFSVQLTDCSIEILEVGSSGESKKASTTEKIGALGAKHFSIEIRTFDISQTAYCFLLLINEHGESIAAREVIFKPRATCLCVHTCKCACGEGTNLKCERLADENIIAAGLYTEVKSPDQIAVEQKQESEKRVKWVFHWILALHLILLVIGLSIWAQRKCVTPEKEGLEEEDLEFTSSSGDPDEENEEGETDEDREDDDEGKLDSARSTEGSEITLYNKKKSRQKMKEDKSSEEDIEHEQELSSKSTILKGPASVGGPSGQKVTFDGSKATMSDKVPSTMSAQALNAENSSTMEYVPENPSQQNTNNGGAAESDENSINNQEINSAFANSRASVSQSANPRASVSPLADPRASFSQSGNPRASVSQLADPDPRASVSQLADPRTSVSQSANPSNRASVASHITTYDRPNHELPPIFDEPIPGYDDAVHDRTTASHIVRPSHTHTKKEGGLYVMTPSDNWGNLNNTDSTTESNIESFLSFCATASSSRTSVGTYNRRKREQYSAYDFLPAPKHKGSVTWED